MAAWCRLPKADFSSSPIPTRWHFLKQKPAESHRNPSVSRGQDGGSLAAPRSDLPGRPGPGEGCVQRGRAAGSVGRRLCRCRCRDLEENPRFPRRNARGSPPVLCPVNARGDAPGAGGSGLCLPGEGAVTAGRRASKFPPRGTGPFPGPTGAASLYPSGAPARKGPREQRPSPPGSRGDPPAPCPRPPPLPWQPRHPRGSPTSPRRSAQRPSGRGEEEEEEEERQEAGSGRTAPPAGSPSPAGRDGGGPGPSPGAGAPPAAAPGTWGSRPSPRNSAPSGRLQVPKPAVRFSPCPLLGPCLQRGLRSGLRASPPSSFSLIFVLLFSAAVQSVSLRSACPALLLLSVFITAPPNPYQSQRLQQNHSEMHSSYKQIHHMGKSLCCWLE